MMVTEPRDTEQQPPHRAPATRRGRVVVGLSGGVDSAVAALRLQAAGHEVIGVFMKNWDDDDAEGQCAAAQDLEDARAVAQRLEIPLYKVSFAAEYRERVFDHFLTEHRTGRTPNPDVLCNREIKFRAFLDYALELGAERIATGHYAAIGRRGGHLRLLEATDPGKDQTYFLYMLGQRELAHSTFPLNDLRKDQVRRIARESGLPNHAKKDSTGLCFVGERDFRRFLGRYLTAEPGAIVSVDGTHLGTHHGLAFYTLGQRQGLGIGGRAGASPSPWYVVDKDTAANELIVAQGSDHPRLFHRALEADSLYWVTGEPPPTPLRCRARLRHRQPPQPCTLSAITHGRAQVRFETPQRAVTPGQSIVFYLEDECLGGGIIVSRSAE